MFLRRQEETSMRLMHSISERSFDRTYPTLENKVSNEIFAGPSSPSHWKDSVRTGRGSRGLAGWIYWRLLLPSHALECFAVEILQLQVERVENYGLMLAASSPFKHHSFDVSVGRLLSVTLACAGLHWYGFLKQPRPA